jgi:NAD(P)-dependent dehydrogenase (short-subunit alcohol dehydrogenase family)
VPQEIPSILLIGASRGLGQAMAAEFIGRGWRVTGTVRGEGRTPLHDLAETSGGRLEIETVDMDAPEQISGLRERLSGQTFDILFANGGVSGEDWKVADVPTDGFARMMVTNALGPMRIVEALQDLVPADGLIGIMSSGQGSVSNNTRGGHEIYRATKAALNQLMRSWAARNADDPRALILMAPGWIRTALGGPDAPFTMEENVPKVVDVLLAQRGRAGLRYLDFRGDTVAW